MKTKSILFMGNAIIVFLCISTFFISVFLLQGCSDDFALEKIQQMLESSQFMNEPATTILGLYVNNILPESDLRKEHPEMEVFLTIGYVTIKPHTIIIGQKVGAEFILTPEGDKARASGGWSIIPGTQVQQWSVETARKKFIEASEPEYVEKIAKVSFKWKWEPNKIGEGLGLTRETSSACAKFKREKNEWQLTEIVNGESCQ
jgi:hypothetical protein